MQRSRGESPGNTHVRTANHFEKRASTNYDIDVAKSLFFIHTTKVKSRTNLAHVVKSTKSKPEFLYKVKYNATFSVKFLSLKTTIWKWKKCLIYDVQVTWDFLQLALVRATKGMDSQIKDFSFKKMPMKTKLCNTIKPF